MENETGTVEANAAALEVPPGTPPSTPSRPTLRRVLAVAGVALALGGGVIGAGIAYAQTPTPTRPPAAQGTPRPDAAQRQQRGQQFLDAVAAKLGVTGDRLRQAMEDARNELGLPAPGAPGAGFHRPFGGPGRPSGPMGQRAFSGPLELEGAAKAIGITTEQLRQELPGKTLADVAKAHNVDPQKVAGTISADIIARIDQAVANGRISADRATQNKQNVAQQVERLMARQFPAGRPGGQGGPGPRGNQNGPRPFPRPGAPAGTNQ
ncbi:MAG: hypothetical protein HY332_20155 [Chloroflexi bacterium]|nr:hypothetical protein [Chloroflexota bacterium]